MNIISKECQEGRMIDGIKTILNLNQNDFNEIIKELKDYKELKNISFWYTTDQCEIPENNVQLGIEKTYDTNGNYIGRGYFGTKQYCISEILKKIEEIKNHYFDTSIEYSRINELLDTRNLDAFKKYYVQTFNIKGEILDKIFEILQNKKLLEEFMDYDKNIKDFAIDGINEKISVYLNNLVKIFGKNDVKNGSNYVNVIYKEFYIKEIDEYKNEYKKILEKYNLDGFENSRYEFRGIAVAGDFNDEVIRKGEEPDWKISDELRYAIYNKMPSDLSIEEKAMYIYCKLCKELKYDQKYFYRKQVKNNRYKSDFSKEHLERIVPNSNITCFDFARVFAKFIDELEGDIEAVIISRGINRAHFLTGFYTNKVSVMLEAINGKTWGTNDLVKAKAGIEFEGIHIISDREGIINKAMKKVYNLVFEEKSVPIEEYIEQLKVHIRPKVQINFEKKFESFIQVLKERKIDGNEAVQLFLLFNHMNFFGENVERAFIGKKIISNGEISYQRYVLLKKHLDNIDKFYLFNTENLSLKEVQAKDIRSKLNSGEYIYENKKQHIEDLDMEEK